MTLKNTTNFHVIFNVICCLKKTQKCWILTVWTLDYDQLAKDYSALDIDWLRDISFIHDQNYTPHPVTEIFFNNKRIPGTDKLSYVPFNRFVLPVQDALKLQLR